MFSKRKVAALTAEFLGSAIVAFVVLTVSRSQIGVPYFVAIAAGATVLLLGLTLTRDVQFNPAYTLALWTARRIKTLKAIAFIAVQLLGGGAAYLLYKYVFAQDNVVQPLPSEYRSELLIAEALGAFIFAFAAAGALYRQRNQLVRNVTTGMAYTIGAIAASVASAGFINPAVALASNAWAWSTYVLGPVLGAVIGVNLYSLLFADRESREIRKTDRSADVASAKAEKRLNKDAIEVSPAAVADKPLAKVEKAERTAKAEKKAEKKAKSKKSKK